MTETPRQCDLDGCTNDAVGTCEYGHRCQYHLPDAEMPDPHDIRESLQEAYYTEEPTDE